MAKIELNIVALGDFKSVNTEIGKLKAQVDLLNKSLAGIGLSSNNNLSKQLKEANDAFKATMLSTGQFTANTVKLTAETDKFGQSLVTGKLKLTEYFSIIKNGTSNASAQMRALALEQTKLQNSIVQSDPTKQGVMSVYTPTKINQVANATKIAANMQNIYNLAVDKGTQSLINWGKNTQWAGRQLTVGMTVPLTIFGNTAMQTFQQVNDELVRLQKVYGTGLSQPTQAVLDSIKSQVLGLSRELASSMGIAAKDTAAMAADLAATGKTGNDLIVATREAMRLSKLGELDTQAAMKATVSLQNVYKLSTQDLSGAVNFLNAVENQTSTSLQDLVDGIPRVGPIVKQLGGSFKDTAVMMVAMKEAGIPAAQSANAIKSAIASLINPTKAARDAFAAYNIDLGSISTKTKGNPVEMIMMLQQALKGLAPLAQAQLIEKLFGKFQEARIQALITNLGAVNSQTKTAFDLMSASDSQLSSIASSEMKIATESTTGRFKRAVETVKADLIPLGQKVMEIATSLLNFGNSVAHVFSGLPGPVKTVLGIIAGGIALSGPVIMFTGVLANFVGYLLKGLFAMKDLLNGTKTFGQLFTPEMIASQNAAELFSKKMLTDAESTAILNSAVRTLTMNIEAMSVAMNTASTTSFIERAALSIPFKAPKMATGGWVPGNPSEGDAYPAMLMGGEAVIPTVVAKQYAPFINGMLNGNLPGYEDGTEKTVLGHMRSNFKSGDKIYDEFMANNPDIARFKENVEGAEVRIMSNLTARMPHSLNAKLRDSSATEEDIRTGLTHPLAFGEAAGKGGLTEQELQDPATRKALTDLQNQVRRRAQALARISGPLGDEEMDQVTRDVIQRFKKLGGASARVAETLDKAGSTFGGSRVFLEKERMQAEIEKGTVRRRAGTRSSYETYGQLMYGDAQVGEYGGSDPNRIKDRNKNAYASTNPKYKSALNKAREEELGIALDQASQSQSPSRATKRAAKNMVDGAIEGIKEGKPRVKNAANIAFEEALLASNAGPVASGMDETALATETTPGLAATQSGRFAKIRAARMRVRSKLPGFMTGRFSGLGMGIGLQIASQFAGPMIDKLPGGNIANDAIQGASFGSFLGPEGALVGAAFGGLFGGIKKLMDMEKMHAANAQATFKSSSDAAQMFNGVVQDTTTPVINLDKITAAALPKMDAIKSQAKNFSDAIAKLPKDNAMSLIFDQMKNTSDSKAAAIAKAFADTQVAVGNLDPTKAQQMIDLYLASTGHASAVGTPTATGATSVKSATAAAIKNAQGKTGLSYREQQALQIQQSILNDPAYAGTAHTIAENNIKALQSKAAVGNQQQLGKTLKEIVNPMEKASISAKDYADKIAAITENTVVNKNGLAAYASALTSKAEAPTKNAALQLAGLNINLADGIKYLTLYTATKGNSPILAQIMKDAKDPNGAAKLAADMKLLNDEINKLLGKKPDSNGSNSGNGKQNPDPYASATVFSGTTAQKALKKLLEARVKDENVVLKGLNDQLKNYKEQVAEAKRLSDYEQQRFSLLQDQKTALMSGNYLGAAEFKQASTALTVDFNAGTKEYKMQKAIDKVQTQGDRFAIALADLNDAIANGSKKIDASISKIAGEKRIAADATGTGTISVQNNITISSLESPQQIATAVAKQAQAGTISGIHAAKKQTNGKTVAVAR